MTMVLGCFFLTPIWRKKMGLENWDSIYIYLAYDNIFISGGH